MTYAPWPEAFALRFCSGGGRQWPSFDSVLWFHPNSRRGAFLLWTAPWFHPTAVHDAKLIFQHMDGASKHPTSGYPRRDG